MTQVFKTQVTFLYKKFNRGIQLVMGLKFFLQLVVVVFCISSTGWSAPAPVTGNPDDVPRAEGVSVSETAETEKDAKKPLQLSLSYTSEVMGPFAGGVKRKADFLGSLTVGADLDLERLLQLPQTQVLIQGLALHGGSPGNSIGDLQGASNIEAPRQIRLYQAWIQKTIGDDQFSLLAGVHDLNSEFYVTDASLLFVNSAFAIGPELTESGTVGPSIYPNPGLAARASARIIQDLSIRAGLYEAIPTDPQNPTSSKIRYSPSDGFLAIGQLEWKTEIRAQPTHVSMGYWAYTRKQEDLSEKEAPIAVVDPEAEAESEPAEGDAQRVRSQGIYATLNQKIYSEIEGRDPGLSSFFRIGWASPEANRLSGTLSLGLNYLGLFKGRELDELGLGISLSRASSHELRAQAQEKGDATQRQETVFELTYRAQFNSWLSVQPDLQWIVHPGLDPSLRNAWVGAARLSVSL